LLQRCGQVRQVGGILHLLRSEPRDRLETAGMNEVAVVVERTEKGLAALESARRQALLELDEHARPAPSDGLHRAVEYGLLVAFHVDLYEAGVAFVEAVEGGHRHLDGAVAAICRRCGGRHRGAPRHRDAVDDRRMQFDRAAAIGQCHRLDLHTVPELLGQRPGQAGHGLEGDDPPRVAAQEVHVAAVVGADVNGIAVSIAQELEQVQLDLAIAPVEAGLAPVEQGLRAERPQRLTCLPIDTTISTDTPRGTLGLRTYAHDPTSRCGHANGRACASVAAVIRR